MLQKGSSPLTRGKPEGDARAKDEDRLIPAHAGKTEGLEAGPNLGLAHPRSRGENRGCGSGLAWEGGSSPLTRGKHCVELRGRLVVGLIPAHAGKTWRP